MVRKLIAGLVVLVLVVLGGYWWWWHQGREDTDNAYVKADILPVMTRIDGTVLAVPVEENRTVSAGDLLIQLDPALFQTRLAQQQALVAAAQSQLDHLSDRVMAQQALIQAAEAAVRGADAELQRARQSQSRLLELRRQQSVAQDNLDAAALLVASGEAGLQQQTAQLAAQKANLVTIRGEKPGLQAALDQALAARDQAQLELGYCEIRAARAGIISSKQVQEGQSVSPGSRLLSLVTSPVWVYANFKETQIEHMKVGQPAELHADAWPGIVFKGHVDSFAAATGSEFALLPPQNATGNFTRVVQRLPVRIVLEDGQDVQKLRPGLSVTATVFTE
jgi:membrane fusion protein, multidrug efflux system